MESAYLTTEKGLAVSLRRMFLRDLDTVLAIEGQVHYHPWTFGNFQDCLQAGNQCWVVELVAADKKPEAENTETENIIAAYGVMSYGGGEAELLNISVAPQCHRQGIAGCLLEFMLTQLEAADTVFLEVRESNRAAIALYDSLGFNEVGVRPNYYPSKKGREDALIFAKPLLG